LVKVIIIKKMVILISLWWTSIRFLLCWDSCNRKIIFTQKHEIWDWWNKRFAFPLCLLTYFNPSSWSCCYWSQVKEIKPKKPPFPIILFCQLISQSKMQFRLVLLFLNHRVKLSCCKLNTLYYYFVPNIHAVPLVIVLSNRMRKI